MAVAEPIQTAQIPVGCQLCDGGDKIQWKCLDCSLLLCTKCKDKVHLKFKNAKDHKIIDIKKVGQPETETFSFDFQDNKCEEHIGQACCLYCKTCEQFICLKCLTQVHIGHDVIEEEEYKAEMKYDLDIQMEGENQLRTLSHSKAVPRKLLEFPHRAGSENCDKIEQQKNTIKPSMQCTTDMEHAMSTVANPNNLLWIKQGYETVKHVTLSGEVISEFTVHTRNMTVTSSKR